MENLALRGAREKAGSMMRVAGLARIDTQTLWKLEKRGVEPKLSTARRLARAISQATGKRYTVDDLFPEDDDEERVA